MSAERDPHPQMRGALNMEIEHRLARYLPETHDRLCHLLVERDKEIESLKKSTDGLVKWVVVLGLISFFAVAALAGISQFKL